MKPSLLALCIALCMFFGGAASAASPVRAISPSDLEKIIADEKGNLVVVNLWATWCAPCLVEIPDLIKLEKELADLKVKLIGISVDEPGPAAKLIESMKARYFPDFLTYARDKTEVDYLVSVIDPAWNEVVPTTYILDREGKLKKRIQGKKSLEEFKAEVIAASK